MKRAILSLLLVFGLIPLAQAADTDGANALKYLPVQDSGRVKPFDTFARETLQLVHGSQTYKSKDGERRQAYEVVMTWILVPGLWDQQKFVEVSHRGLKESLGLPNDQKYFSPTELFENGRLGLVMQNLAGKRETKEKLDPYFQAAQRLESQLGMYQAVKQGSVIRVVPPAPSQPQENAGGLLSEPDRWVSVAELDGELRQKFSILARSFVHSLQVDKAAAAGEGAHTGEQPPPALAAVVSEFKDLARSRNPALYPDEKSIAIEVHYKSIHPFLISWIGYLLAAILLAFAWQSDSKKMYAAGWSLAILAFIAHTYGFGLRMYITGRPPVSNMYESVVWVSWGALVFSFVFEYLNRRKFILMSGAIVGVLCLVVADLAPTVLDSSLQPLEPVLRSNMWLTVHVLTITLSYSAFFLAWALGNLGIGFILRGDKPTDERARVLTQSIYRAIQVGVVLLAAGTILGGVWADYSWGRFWGWDPKETWALIALLGYLALLHGRLAGLVQNFGMMIGAIVSFNLVIMAWYGVNYVLGAGLHSYGFGAGGVEYVSAFVLLDLIFAAYVGYVLSQRKLLATRAAGAVPSETKTT